MSSLTDRLNKGFFAFRVNNRRVSFLLVFLIILLGLLSLRAIPKESSPTIKFWIITVVTSYPWVNPTDMDTLITEEIEQAIDDIDGIKKITSQSNVGFAVTTIELENDTDTSKALTEIKDEIDKLTLPEEANDPQVTEITTSNDLMFELLLYGDENMFPPQRLIWLAEDMRNKLEETESIASIDVSIVGAKGEHGTAKWGGSLDYELHVLVDKTKVEQMSLSIIQIANIIRSFNKNVPLGSYEIDHLKYDFRIEGEIKNTTQLLNIPLLFQGYSLVRLGDIATVEKKYDDESINKLVTYQHTWANVISLIVNKASGANIFESAKQAKQVIQDFLATQKFKWLQAVYASDMSELITKDYKTLTTSWIQTLVFVFLILLVFIAFKEASIATFAIPLAFLVTFFVLDQLWLSLNFLTNFSLVLTLWIAIDTTIVIIEAAAENIKIGYNKKSAILLAVRDYKAALISGTMTTVVVFIPLMMLPGVMGKFLAYIPITVFSTLLAALFISLTLNSALFYKLSKKYNRYISHPKSEQFLGEEEKRLLNEERKGKIIKTKDHLTRRQKILEKLNDYYEKILRIFLMKKSHRILSVLTPVILLILSFIFLSPSIGATIFPASDNNRFDLVFTTKKWSLTQDMLQYLPLIENILQDIPELKFARLHVQDNNIQATIELIDKKIRQNSWQRDVFEVEHDVVNPLQVLEQQGVRVESQVLAGGPPSGKPVGIKLIAQHNDQFMQLMDVARDFRTYLRSLPGVKNANISSEPTPGQFIYHFNNEKLRSLGLTPSDIAPEIAFALNGFPAWSITLEDTDRDIKVLYKEFTGTIHPDDIENIIINTKVWPVRVGEVVDYNIDNAVASITREEGEIMIRVESDLETSHLNKWEEIQKSFEQRAEKYTFPQWISYEKAGEASENADLINALIRGFLISVFLIMIILVLQFNSFRKPTIILYSIICALLWVNIWLFLTGNPYSMPFAIWFIALTGIVVNDAIIMITRIGENTSHGINIFESIIEAGRSRLQPIILTTLTTLLGILPISFQDKFWEGLGLTIVFGLFTGSLLTLFVIPSLYYMVFGKEDVKGKEKEKNKEISGHFI